MKNILSKILFLLICFSLFLVSNTLAYSIDAATEKKASQLVFEIEKKLDTLSVLRAERLKLSIHKKLFQQQNTYIGKKNTATLQKNAMYEFVRRKLFPDSFDTPEAIFDDGVGAIWTHAPKGFDILYYPLSTPTIGSLSSGTSNTLINGSYFSRLQDSKYHSGLLWTDNSLWSEMIYDDKQITHIVCLDSNHHVTFWPNSMYFDGLMDICDKAFQAGPMMYSLVDNTIDEDLFPKTYIGNPHNRTVMVLFENNGKQDLWFLTLIKPATLANVRDVVLRESRFRNEYDTLTIFNLDGGSSVAHRNPDHPELNFGSNKALPLVFEIYK